jgi:hypothetical protein
MGNLTTQRQKISFQFCPFVNLLALNIHTEEFPILIIIWSKLKTLNL